MKQKQKKLILTKHIAFNFPCTLPVARCWCVGIFLLFLSSNVHFITFIIYAKQNDGRNV